jgi:hypothetical protein
MRGIQVLLAVGFESLREMRAEYCSDFRHRRRRTEEQVESGTRKSSEVLRLAKVVRAERESDLAAVRLRQLAAEVIDPPLEREVGAWWEHVEASSVCDRLPGGRGRASQHP